MNEMQRFKHSADFLANSSHIIESARAVGTDLPKSGWAMAHPAHPGTTGLDHIACTFQTNNFHD